jgi:GxxExxY protein
MNDRDSTAENTRVAEQKRNLNQLTELVIGAAIEVQRALGPGLLESTHEMCVCRELTLKEIPLERQKPIPVGYKGIKLDCGYRADLVVDQVLLVEINSVDFLPPICDAQLLTYLKLGGWKVGLMINFNVELLKRGISSESARPFRRSFIMNSAHSAISAVNLR